MVGKPNERETSQMMKKVDMTALLDCVRDAGAPIGATYLSEVMNIPSATVGRMLRMAESEGYLTRISNKGRCLTEKGQEYLDCQETLDYKKASADKLVGLMQDLTKEQLLGVMQVRKLLEGYTAELACANVSELEIAEMETILLEYELEVRRGGLGNEPDLQFHLSIAKATRNAILHQILKIILTTDNAYSQFSSVADTIQNRKMCVDQHTEILNAIKDHDVARSKKAMETHLNKVISDIEQHY